MTTNKRVSKVQIMAAFARWLIKGIRLSILPNA